MNKYEQLNENEFSSGITVIKVNPPFIKLEQFLKFAGIVDTGGQAKQLVLNGQVFLNGEICLMRSKKIYDGDIIKVKGLSDEFRCVF